jgi:hypothetical protein
MRKSRKSDSGKVWEIGSETQLSTLSVPAARENYVVYHDKSRNIDYIHCKW